MGMTSKGAQMVIDAASMRVFEIDEIINVLNEEKKRLQTRIMELETIRDLERSAEAIVAKYQDEPT